jgi:hypothetical protein
VLYALASTLDVGIPYPLPHSNAMPAQETTPVPFGAVIICPV